MISWEMDQWGDYTSILGYEIMYCKGEWLPYYEGFSISCDTLTLEQAKRQCEEHFLET